MVTAMVTAMVSSQKGSTRDDSPEMGTCVFARRPITHANAAVKLPHKTLRAKQQER